MRTGIAVLAAEAWSGPRGGQLSAPSSGRPASWEQYEDVSAGIVVQQILATAARARSALFTEAGKVLNSALRERASAGQTGRCKPRRDAAASAGPWCAAPTDTECNVAMLDVSSRREFRSRACTRKPGMASRAESDGVAGQDAWRNLPADQGSGAQWRQDLAGIVEHSTHDTLVGWGLKSGVLDERQQQAEFEARHEGLGRQRRAASG